MTSDLTLAVIAHDETAVSGPTMTSADRAVAAAREAGLTVTALIGLDAPTPQTRAYFGEPRFDHWERRELAAPDRARVHGALAAEGDGRYLTVLAAGGLVSRNWLVEGFRVLQASTGRGERAIAHPELHVVFDGRREVVHTVDQGSPLFTRSYLPFGRYHRSPCLAPPAALVDLPDPVQRDGRFTVQTLAAGWRHLVVPDTIGFERVLDLPGR